MNINLRPKKCSGQSRYGRYGSYATALKGPLKYLCLFQVYQTFFWKYCSSTTLAWKQPLPPFSTVRQTEAVTLLTAVHTFLDSAPLGLLMLPYKCWDNAYFHTSFDYDDRCGHKWSTALGETYCETNSAPEGT